MMGSSESSIFLSPIVATLRADVQGGVSHAIMWTKTRKPFHREEIQSLRTSSSALQGDVDITLKAITQASGKRALARL
jgi:hypothetical protein